jgi:prepilin-type N-terminal cleavage/methylation domain-containing protein
MSRTKSARAFTLIELLVVIAIIGILSAVVLASVNSSRSKGRFATVTDQMNEIARVVEMANNDNNAYPADVGPDTMPTELADYMSAWPTPPCDGWVYDYENWNSGDNIAIDIRNTANETILYRCILDNTTNCPAIDSGAGYNIITNWPSKSLTCSETRS